MKLISCVRQKNGLKYLPRLMKQLKDISDEIVILDDYSTDGSYEWLVKETKTPIKPFHVLRQKDLVYSGGRDWNMIHSFVAPLKPDWVLMIDVDELIEESQAFRIRELAETSGRDILGWSFPFYYLWNDEQHYRDDGVYHNTRVIRLLRYLPYMKPPQRATHTTMVPDELDRRMLPVADVRMWHFGYMLSEDRQAKFDFYTKRDKDPMAAGSGGKNYDHMMKTPTDLSMVPSYNDWSKWDWVTPADCLQKKPIRVAVGGVYPTAKELTLMDLKLIPDKSLDSLRCSYLLDGMESVRDIKMWLKEFFRVLRQGGRLEVITLDFEGICRDFVVGDFEKRSALQNKFLVTPHRQRVSIIFCEQILGGLVQEAGFGDWQQVPLPEFPHRLYGLAFRGGENKW